LFPSVNVIAEKKIIRRGWKTAHLEKTYEIRILSVDVTDDLHGWRQLDQRRLTEKHIACCEADGRNLGVFKAKRLVDFPSVSNIKQSLDHVVNVQLFQLFLESAI